MNSTIKKAEKNNVNGCLLSIFGLIAVFFAFSFVIIYLTSSQDLWIWNRSGKNILIKNCSLNGTLLDKCNSNLSKERDTVLDISDTIYHCKQNHFQINVTIDNKNYIYTCDFYRKVTDCQEETSISDRGLFCEKYCSSIYD